MEERNNTNNEKGLFAVAVGTPLLIVVSLVSMVREGLDVRPREIREYKQMVESRGENFNINDFYDLIKPRYHHRFSDVSICK